MKIFDEDGNFIGEFISDSVEQAKDSYDDSGVSGCLFVSLLLSIKFPFILVLIIFWYFLKLMWVIFKFFLRIFWWIIRLPFTLIFRGEFPEF